MCREFTLHADEVRQGSHAFSFDAGVYAHPAVKQALIAAQHSKCCFCERKVGADGDVEHFRPKAGVRQTGSSPMLKPGYYWLAYDWDNLLLFCSACNSRHKRNLFPLVNPEDRAASHNDSIDAEQPLFIHPARIDPAKHISFRKEIPYAVRGNRFAKQTIAALGLDREILNEVRRDKLNILIKMRQVLDCRTQLAHATKGRKVLAQAEKYLNDAVSDTAEFAGMARAAAARLDFACRFPDTRKTKGVVMSAEQEADKHGADKHGADKHGADFKNIDFRQQPERYRIGRGEQGVLSVEPYKSEILPHWRFKTVDEAQVSAARIYALYLDYKQAGDFVGMDMARKFLQMGYTRARRYANHPSGRKYAPISPFQNGLPADKPAKRQLLPQAADWATGEKAQAAQIFHGCYEKVIKDADYQQRAQDHRTRCEK